MEEEKFLNARDFSRVDADIPLDARLLAAEEQTALRSRLAGDMTFTESHDLPDLDNKLLSDWLKMLNAKLDTVLNMLAFQRQGFYSLPATRVNISGGGMSFSAKENYKPGNILELKMLLPLLPPVALYLYGEVVKTQSQPEGPLIFVKFIAIDEEIRDELVKFVFKRQRDILREKRR